MEWNDLIARSFYRVPGEHALVIGSTGTGKTQCLYYIYHGIKKHGKNESFVSFDCGKSSEILKLLEFGEVAIHHPTGTRIDLRTKDPILKSRAVFRQFDHPTQLWDQLVPGRINVISIEPFFPDPKEYSIEVTDVFKQLILKARRYYFNDAGLIPMTIFIDELQWLVPAEKSALCRQHNEGGKWFQRNIELLRSMRIRIVGSTQGWMKLRPGARESFSWLWIKRGARFSIDKPRLSQFNAKFQQLHDDEVLVVSPDGTFSNALTLEFYGRGESLGRVLYYDTAEEVLIKPATTGYA